MQDIEFRVARLPSPLQSLLEEAYHGTHCSIGRPRRQCDDRSKRKYDLTPSREGHYSTAQWSSSVLLLD